MCGSGPVAREPYSTVLLRVDQQARVGGGELTLQNTFTKARAGNLPLSGSIPEITRQGLDIDEIPV
jgi:hypothetical protein